MMVEVLIKKQVLTVFHSIRSILSFHVCYKVLGYSDVSHEPIRRYSSVALLICLISILATPIIIHPLVERTAEQPSARALCMSGLMFTFYLGTKIETMSCRFVMM